MLVAVGLYDRGMIGEAFTFRLHDATEVPYGAWVRVPMAGKSHCGVVLGAGSDAGDHAIYDVEACEEHPLGFQLQQWQCDLILWMSKWYYSPLHKVLRLFIPAPLWSKRFEPKEERMVTAATSSENIPARQKQVRALVERLQDAPMPFEELRKEFSATVYNKARDAGFITITSLGLLPVYPWHGNKQAPKTLTKEQQQIVDGMERKYPEIALLYGVTGAGKTEIYLHRAMQMQQMGKQTLLLVPEIALTPQLVAYFQRVFGQRVAVIHSHLAEGEKCQEWLRVARHEVDIIVGSRSAVFAPFAALGMIIMDEEHEWTYKNEQNPRYLTHRVVEALADCMAPSGSIPGILFASGTPSMERFARARKDAAQEKQLHLYTLEARIFEQTPAV